MALTQRLSDVARRFLQSSGTAAPEKPVPDSETGTVRFALPSPFGGQPWISVVMNVSTRHGRYGDRTRVRAQLSTLFPVWQKAAGPLSPPRLESPAGKLVNKLPQRVRDQARRTLSHVSGKKLNTWIDVHSSTLPLNGGAAELASEVVRRLGLVPAEPQEHQTANPNPNLQHWQGRFIRPGGGVAQLNVLHASDLPLPAPLKEGRFNMAASVLTTVEPAENGGEGSGV